jgi:hypothetical protein
LTAASATFALKAAVWFRRGRLFMVSPVRGDYRRCQAKTPLIDLFKFASPALLYRLRSLTSPKKVLTTDHFWLPAQRDIGNPSRSYA